MKTRRILPLVLLAVVALFALSSCDQMLDAIFSSNQITVNVRVDGLVFTDYYYPGSYVQVVLSGSDGSTYTSGQSAVYTVDSLSYVHYSFTFPKLPSVTYTLAATYHGSYYGNYYRYSFTDPSGPPPVTSITMPYKSGGSSSSVVVDVTFP
jgi:hypothetical protein